MLNEKYCIIAEVEELVRFFEGGGMDPMLFRHHVMTLPPKSAQFFRVFLVMGAVSVFAEDEVSDDAVFN